jgi:hypothetical protein
VWRCSRLEIGLRVIPATGPMEELLKSEPSPQPEPASKTEASQEPRSATASVSLSPAPSARPLAATRNRVAMVWAGLAFAALLMVLILWSF